MDDKDNDNTKNKKDRDSDVLNTSQDMDLDLNLFDMLRARIDDSKPLVRAKAIQTFGAALALNWPKVSSSAALFQCEDETVSMLITEDDISVFFDRCCDLSLATRKQALASLSELVQARPADEVLQDAWVTGALPLATDPESSVQQKLSQCCFDLIISNAVLWAKYHSSKDKDRGDVDVCDLGISLVWPLCARISETGRSKLLKTCISTMMQQDVIKAAPSKTVTFSIASSNNLNVILQAVKLACCTGLSDSDGDMLESNPLTADYEQISRGGWVLLEALISQNQESSNNTPAISNIMSMNNTMFESASFVITCFFKKQEQKKLLYNSIQDGSEYVSCLDEDDVRILRVLERVTDGVAHEDLIKTKLYLLLQINQLSSSANSYSVAVNVLFAISKSLAKISVTGNNSVKGKLHM